MDSTKHYVGDQKTNQWVQMKPQELEAYKIALEKHNGTMYGMGSSYIAYGLQAGGGYTFVFSTDYGAPAHVGFNLKISSTEVLSLPPLEEPKKQFNQL